MLAHVLPAGRIYNVILFIHFTCEFFHLFMNKNILFLKQVIEYSSAITTDGNFSKQSTYGSPASNFAIVIGIMLIPLLPGMIRLKETLSNSELIISNCLRSKTEYSQWLCFHPIGSVPEKIWHDRRGNFI